MDSEHIVVEISLKPIILLLARLKEVKYKGMLTKNFGHGTTSESWRIIRKVMKLCAASYPDKMRKSKDWFDKRCKEKLLRWEKKLPLKYDYNKYGGSEKII